MRGYESSEFLITIDGIRQDIDAGTITGTFLDTMFIKKLLLYKVVIAYKMIVKPLVVLSLKNS